MYFLTRQSAPEYDRELSHYSLGDELAALIGC